MKKTEIIFVILLFIGLSFKFLLLPLGGTITTLSAMSLSILYYIFGFAYFNQIKLKGIFKKDSYKEASILRIIGSVGTGIALSTILIGILFKVQKWPLANDSLMVGLLLSVPILIIVLIKVIKNRAPYYKRILLRIFVFGVVGFFFISMSDLGLVKIQFRNHPNYIKAYELYEKEPLNDSLRDNLGLEFKRTYMDDKTFNAYKKYQDSQKANK
jgi:hypothetical protein